jgi:hypothetical protein
MHPVSRHKKNFAFLGALGVLGGLSLLTTGCRIGGDGKSYLNENDELRQENLALQRQVEQTREEVDRMVAELEALREQNAGDQPIEGAVQPVFSGLKFARYTGLLDSDGDGVNDKLRIYLRPIDQFGRLHVTAGRVRLQVVHLQDEGEPKTIAEQVYTPQDLDKAYRTGFTGDHYSLELPLDADRLEGVDQVTAKVTLTESGSGLKHSTQDVFRINR